MASIQCDTEQCLCGSVCVFILRATQCTHDQPGDYAFGRILFVHWCMFTFASMPTFACVCLCVCAGHPEAARPDVLESGLCGVMSGSLADSADFEQCTQVSPANELSI